MKKTTKGAARMYEYEQRIAQQVEDRVRHENKVAKTESLTGSQNKPTMTSAAISSNHDTINVSLPADDQPNPLSAPIASSSTHVHDQAVSSDIQNNVASNSQAASSSSGISGMSHGSGFKRKSDGSDGSIPSASRSRLEESRGEKRGPDQMEGDGDMSAWLDELCRIAGEGRNTVMMLDCDSNLDLVGHTQDIAEVFSPPRVVRVARSHGLAADWSIDKLTERSPGEP